MEALYTALLVFTLVLSVGFGWWVRSRLDERHLARDSVDSIRLMMSMLLTFSALVLGLLTSNAKQRFDGLSDDLSAFSADLIELDHGLLLYGSEANGVRVQLRRYTAAAIADSWPGETPPGGNYPRFQADPEKTGIEGVELGNMLSGVEASIEHLTPADTVRQQIASRLRSRAVSLIEQRWRLIFSSRSTVSWPFLLTLTSWLAIIFALFGMTSPPGRIVYAVVALSALSIASPLYLILDYSDALSGAIALSSTPMRAALAHMDAGE